MREDVDFVHEHYSDCKRLADSVNVPVENIIGLAAKESQYGGGDIAKRDNNYFSLHAPSPLETGRDPAKGDPHTLVSIFNSFYDCGQSFILRYKKAIKDVADPLEFANNLVKAGFNSSNPKNGGSPGYAKELAGIIHSVKMRIPCK